MPALFINIKIDNEEKFEFFKVTLKDIANLFNEYHIKIRGKRAAECLEYINRHVSKEVNFYQELDESDWVLTSLEMLKHVKSRSVFIYFEDHRLVASNDSMADVLQQFDQNQLDYLCYSFFLASRLTVDNLLPLGTHQCGEFDYFELTQKSLPLLGAIAPSSYTFSLVSICSREYFKTILTMERARILLYNDKINAVMRRLFPYPASKVMYSKINNVMSRIGMRLCMHHPSTPFNMEKMWFESKLLFKDLFRFGVLKKELYTNYDDDNGISGESLIKKGQYPFKKDEFNHTIFTEESGISHRLFLNDNDRYDCTYYSNHGRITRAPIVTINVVSGSIEVNYLDDSVILDGGMVKHFYSNLRPFINCRCKAEVELRFYDLVFK